MESFFMWLEDLQLAQRIDPAGYLVPAINVTHLVALTVFIGAVLIVDLRLFGRGMNKEPLARVAQDAQPWLIGSFVIMAITGVMQIVGTPLKAYYSTNFWLKMQLLVVALLFTFIVRRRVTRADEKRLGPIWGKLVAVVSIALWSYVAVQGRLIGLLQ